LTEEVKESIGDVSRDELWSTIKGFHERYNSFKFSKNDKKSSEYKILIRLLLYDMFLGNLIDMPSSMCKPLMSDNLISEIRKYHDGSFSFNELSVVFNRSKSSISKAMNHQGYANEPPK
jgi:hypothetical protein